MPLGAEACAVKTHECLVSQTVYLNLTIHLEVFARTAAVEYDDVVSRDGILDGFCHIRRTIGGKDDDFLTVGSECFVLRLSVYQRLDSINGIDTTTGDVVRCSFCT